jgi:RNA polymerase sigma factor (sigma-70 family)
VDAVDEGGDANGEDSHAVGFGLATDTSTRMSGAMDGSVVRVTPADEASPRADAELMTTLEMQHGQALLGFARRLGVTDQQAQDCVQEAMFRLWAELQRGKAIEDPKAWLYRASYRLAMDEHRLRRRIRGLADLLGLSRQAGEPRHDATDRIAVWAEVDRLPARQRQVVYLRYRADLSFDTIAAVLGMSPSAARSHSTQAMQALRTRLDQPSSGVRP